MNIDPLNVDKETDPDEIIEVWWPKYVNAHPDQHSLFLRRENKLLMLENNGRCLDDYPEWGLHGDIEEAELIISHGIKAYDD